MIKAIAFPLLLGLAALPAVAEEIAPVLPLPGESQAAVLPSETAAKPAAAAPAPECAVNVDQLPPDFLRMMKQLGEPVTATAIGTPPDISPSAGMTPIPNKSTRRQNGVEILSGQSKDNKPGISQERGVTIYRGYQAPTSKTR